MIMCTDPLIFESALVMHSRADNGSTILALAAWDGWLWPLMDELSRSANLVGLCQQAALACRTFPLRRLCEDAPLACGRVVGQFGCTHQQPSGSGTLVQILARC